MLALEKGLATEPDSELTDAQVARQDFLKNLAELQSPWEFLIYRTARTAADIEQLRNSNAVTVALTYLHRLIDQ